MNEIKALTDARTMLLQVDIYSNSAYTLNKAFLAIEKVLVVLESYQMPQTMPLVDQIKEKEKILKTGAERTTDSKHGWKATPAVRNAYYSVVRLVEEAHWTCNKKVDKRLSCYICEI